MQVMEQTSTVNTISIDSEFLKRTVTCTLFIPGDGGITVPLNLLLLNDGQEAANLKLPEIFDDLNRRNCLKPLMIAAIHAGDDRIQEYGVAGHPDFKKRGAKAGLYTSFIINELLPGLKELTQTDKFESVVFAGFSLGGLSALDIAWNNPGLFNKAGVFSGSFWWRSKDLSKGYCDNDRIMQAVVKSTLGKPDLKIWLQTGTKDETADRNKNGIIDSIDDTVDLIKELETKGFKRPEDIRYLEVVGGSHNTETWAKAMPKFLIWAFGK